MKHDDLRKTVKKLIIDADYDDLGGQARLATELGIAPQSLNMALTGRRSGKRSNEILWLAHGYLIATLVKKEPDAA